MIGLYLRIEKQMSIPFLILFLNISSIKCQSKENQSELPFEGFKRFVQDPLETSDLLSFNRVKNILLENPGAQNAPSPVAGRGLECCATARTFNTGSASGAAVTTCKARARCSGATATQATSLP